ncbi:MAG: diguanylate cyclase, partial [Pseudolabrys sp.]
MEANIPDAGGQASAPKIARPRRTLSIRARLMLLALIAIVPLMLERIYNEQTDRKDRIEAAYKQALDVARQGAIEQNEVIASARAVLQVIASARATFPASDADCNKFLIGIAQPIPWIKTLSVANARGKIICSSYPEAIGLDISERTHFTKAIDSGDFVLGDYFVGSRVKTPFISLALAQRGSNGGAAAVVIGLLDLSWFEHIATAFVPAHGSMLIIDSKGTALAQYPSNLDAVGRNFAGRPLIKKMLSSREGSITEEDLEGVRRMFGFVQLPGINAHIAVGIDENKVLERVNREMWRSFAELAIVVGLVLIGIWFGGDRLLVKPIQALSRLAGRIGHGDVKVHAADLPWSSEFVPLAAALDGMAAQLSAREQELRDTNHQLREMAQIDALTGLPNRRTFNETLSAEWMLAAKLKQSISVLMIDVDFFKKFNDHYGHVQGDACLRKVAGALMKATRARVDTAAQETGQGLPPSFHRITGHARRSDFVARYGGEEFAVLLQGADLAAALRVGERLRCAVEDLLMSHV